MPSRCLQQLWRLSHLSMCGQDWSAERTARPIERAPEPMHEQKRIAHAVSLPSLHTGRARLRFSFVSARHVDGTDFLSARRPPAKRADIRHR